MLNNPFKNHAMTVSVKKVKKAENHELRSNQKTFVNMSQKK